MLTWIYFRFDRNEDAVKLSNEVIKLTRWKNISSLGNRYIIMCYTGDELEAKKCLDMLKKLNNETEFAELLIEAKAEHAYYYSRLGGSDNLKRSICLFSEAVEARPDNYMWKFGLGLNYRRAMHVNILFSGQQSFNVEELTKNAIRYLFEVADNSDGSLQAMAYAELVMLRKLRSPRYYPEYNEIFRNLNVVQLCNKALEKGNALPYVLTQCGYAKNMVDIDESIALLQKSVAIKESSKAYHFLGNSYKRKAVMNMPPHHYHPEATYRQFSQQTPWRQGCRPTGYGNRRYPEAVLPAMSATGQANYSACQPEHQTPIGYGNRRYPETVVPAMSATGQANYSACQPEHQTPTGYGNRRYPETVLPAMSATGQANYSACQPEHQTPTGYGNRRYPETVLPAMSATGQANYSACQPEHQTPTGYGNRRYPEAVLPAMSATGQANYSACQPEHQTPIGYGNRRYPETVLPAMSATGQANYSACQPEHQTPMGYGNRRYPETVVPAMSATGQANYSACQPEHQTPIGYGNRRYPETVVPAMSATGQANYSACQPEHQTPTGYGNGRYPETVLPAMSATGQANYSACQPEHQTPIGYGNRRYPEAVLPAMSATGQANYSACQPEHQTPIGYGNRRYPETVLPAMSATGQANYSACQPEHQTPIGYGNRRYPETVLPAMFATGQANYSACQPEHQIPTGYGNRRYPETVLPAMSATGQANYSAGQPEHQTPRGTCNSEEQFYNRDQMYSYGATGQRREAQSAMFGTNSKLNHEDRDVKQKFMLHDNEEPMLKTNAIDLCVRKLKSDLSLNKDDELVKKAIESFKKAIQLVKENFPAILDLGILLKETGQIQEALIQFNRITNSHLGSNKISVISAYEQAGLCYLELAKLNTSDKSFEEEGKKKLTKAVQYAADLILLTPELKNTQEFWTAFRTLDDDIDKKKYSGTQQREKIKLLDLAGRYGPILDVVKKLQEYTEEELDKEDIINFALKSYIKLGHIEDGLVFQNIVASRAAARDSAWWKSDPIRNMRIKILLLAIQKRMTEITHDNPTTLFQKVFEILFGICLGAHDIEVEANQLDDGPGRSGDILVVFDADWDPEVYLTEKSALCLKQVATCLFGLQAEENLQGNGQYCRFKSHDEIQLDEMRKYQVVLIVLGNEPRDLKFEAMLHRVPHIEPNQHIPNQRILVIDAGQNVEIPHCLASYECFKLQDIGGLREVEQNQASGSEEYQPSFNEILNHVFRGDVDAVLKLFCFLIGQQWPCP